MKLGLQTMRSTANFGAWSNAFDENLEIVKHAESLGYDSIWTAEASGTDAIVPLAFLAAHTTTMKVGTAVMQMAARTPPMTAMTAATLDILSNGRFILGLGPGGPAVVEGWHCQAYGEPLARTCEYVDIVRRVLARSGPLVHHGHYYDIPYERDDAMGLAQPIRMMIRAKRRKLPIYLAAMGPKNLSLAYRISDGIIPAFYSPWREKEFFDGVERGSRDVELAPFVSIVMGDDMAACRDRARGGLAFWIGGMGARGLNFYNKHVTRLGFGDAARKIQDLYMAERRMEAAAAIPDQLIDEVTLVGSRAHIADQLAAWKESAVTTMILTGADRKAIETVAELVL